MRGYEVVFPANFFLVATARRSFPLPLLFLLHEFAQRLLSPVPPIRIRVHARFVPPHPLLVLLPCRTSTHLSSTLILASPWAVEACESDWERASLSLLVLLELMVAFLGLSVVIESPYGAQAAANSSLSAFTNAGLMYPSLSHFPELSNRPSQAPTAPL